MNKKATFFFFGGGGGGILLPSGGQMNYNNFKIIIVQICEVAELQADCLLIGSAGKFLYFFDYFKCAEPCQAKIFYNKVAK